MRNKNGLDDAYHHLRCIDDALDTLQRHLSKYGFDHIAYGPIANAMGNVLEARCEINKAREGQAERAGGQMTLDPLDELVNELRKQWQNISNNLTDLDEATTGLYEPGGSIFAVRTALWNILHSYLEAGIALDRYEEKRKEKTE